MAVPFTLSRSWGPLFTLEQSRCGFMNQFSELILENLELSKGAQSKICYHTTLPSRNCSFSHGTLIQILEPPQIWTKLLT